MCGGSITLSRRAWNSELLVVGLALWPALLLAARFAGISSLAGSLLHLALLLTVGFAFLRLSPGPAFGIANALTLLRLGLLLLLLVRAVTAMPAADGSWPLFAIALVALLLDAADGWAARRFGCASRFGARFDIETDTVFLLVLPLLLLGSGRAGPWVLLAGTLRPLFLLAGRLYPPLAAPLSPSRRRAFVCGLAASCLLLAFLPPAPPPTARLLAILAVAALVWSFAVDIRRLLVRA